MYVIDAGYPSSCLLQNEPFWRIVFNIEAKFMTADSFSALVSSVNQAVATFNPLMNQVRVNPT